MGAPMMRVSQASEVLYGTHAGLDAAGRDVVDGLMAEAASVGATVLFASHELDRAEAVARRTVVIAGGAVQDDEVGEGHGG